MAKASTMTSQNRTSGQSAGKVPSSQWTAPSTSCSSTQPPGFRFLTRRRGGQHHNQPESPQNSRRGGNIRIYLPEQVHGGLEDGHHVTHVHHVEIIAVQPGILDVVHQELDVGRHPYWLYGAQIQTGDLSTGIQIADCMTQHDVSADVPGLQWTDDGGGREAPVLALGPMSRTFDRPDTGTGSQVQDLLRVFGDGREEKLAIGNL